MKTYVLHERFSKVREDIIIGVYSSPEKALNGMRAYYGEYEEEECDVSDYDDIHFQKVITTKGILDELVLVVTLLIFHLDE